MEAQFSRSHMIKQQRRLRIKAKFNKKRFKMTTNRCFGKGCQPSSMKLRNYVKEASVARRLYVYILYYILYCIYYIYTILYILYYIYYSMYILQEHGEWLMCRCDLPLHHLILGHYVFHLSHMDPDISYTKNAAPYLPMPHWQPCSFISGHKC